MNCSRFNGFGTALAFKDTTEDDITSVQSYVRDDLPIILDSALQDQGLNYDHRQKMCFFGAYASAPANFKFAPGDLKTISAMVRHVKSTVDSPAENEGLHHYANFGAVSRRELSYERNLIKTVFGYVFGSIREQISRGLGDNILKMQNDLFNKAKAMFDKFEAEEENAVILRTFMLNMVDVKMEGEKPKGSLKCIFCDANKLDSIVKVYWKSTNSWILANLNSHLRRNHLNKQMTITDDTSLEEIKPVVVLKNDVQQNNVDDSTVESFEDAIYSQMSVQFIKMSNAVVTNKDKVHSKNVSSRSSTTRKTKAMKLAKMAGNGNCFFLAAAHQLVNSQINTPEHENAAFNLRTEVVEYIKHPAHLPFFIHDLKNRITYDSGAEDEQIVNECLRFLDNNLSKSGCWAGMESIKAVSELKNINIIVVNDDGTAHLPNHFNPQFERSIIVLFSSLTGKAKENSNRCHYDSVINIPSEIITKMSKDISIAEEQYSNFLKESEESIVVEIS